MSKYRVLFVLKIPIEAKHVWGGRKEMRGKHKVSRREIKTLIKNKLIWRFQVNFLKLQINLGNPRILLRLFFYFKTHLSIFNRSSDPYRIGVCDSESSSSLDPILAFNLLCHCCRRLSSLLLHANSPSTVTFLNLFTIIKLIRFNYHFPFFFLLNGTMERMTLTQRR